MPDVIIRPADDPDRYFESDTFLNICKYLKIMFRSTVRSIGPLMPWLLGSCSMALERTERETSH